MTALRAMVSLLAVVMIACPGLRAQQPDSSSSAADIDSCTLTIRSTPDSAVVLVDGVRSGTTPVTIRNLSAGTHVLRLQHPSFESWLTLPIVDTVTFATGENKAMSYSFANRFMIDTDPFDAEILVGDSVMGRSPLLVASPPAIVTLRKPGYKSQTLSLVPVTGGFVKAALQPEWESGGSFPHATPVVEERRSPLRLYVAGAATVLSGTAAAYLKIKADNTYQRYLITGNTSDRARVRDLDRGAGVALIATQVGFALFTYFIFTQ